MAIVIWVSCLCCLFDISDTNWNLYVVFLQYSLTKLHSSKSSFEITNLLSQTESERIWKNILFLKSGFTSHLFNQVKKEEAGGSIQGGSEFSFKTSRRMTTFYDPFSKINLPMWNVMTSWEILEVSYIVMFRVTPNVLLITHLIMEHQSGSSFSANDRHFW